MGSDLKGYDFCIGILTIAIFLSAEGKGVWGQEIPACATKLIPCSNYLNSTTPPETCCSPLREAVRTELKCLCTLYSSPELFKSVGINMTQALMLPKHCGINSTLDLCNKSVPPGSAGPSGMDTGTSTPSPPGSKSGANGLAWIGFSILMSVFMLWTSVVV